MDVISAQLAAAYPESNEDKALQVDGLHEAIVEDYRQSLLVLMGAMVLVLLIACGNVASLLMARSSSRTTEIALRTAMGAGRGRLVRQLLTESAVLAVVAGALGVLLAVWLQDLILGFASMEQLGITDVGVSSQMLMFALALSLGTGASLRDCTVPGGISGQARRGPEGRIPKLQRSRWCPAEERLGRGSGGSLSGPPHRLRPPPQELRPAPGRGSRIPDRERIGGRDRTSGREIRGRRISDSVLPEPEGEH